MNTPLLNKTTLQWRLPEVESRTLSTSTTLDPQRLNFIKDTEVPITLHTATTPTRCLITMSPFRLVAPEAIPISIRQLEAAPSTQGSAKPRLPFTPATTSTDPSSPRHPPL